MYKSRSLAIRGTGVDSNWNNRQKKYSEDFPTSTDLRFLLGQAFNKVCVRHFQGNKNCIHATGYRYIKN